MKKQHLPLLLLLLLAAPASFAQTSTVIKAYIEEFKDIAMEEMVRTGVPASIKLAQGIHETAAGQSSLVRKSNNHFGIKCKTGWTGESVSHDDDARGECFRKYDDPAQSYKDHSEFLKTRSHYNFLFSLDPTDYEAWAHGLKKAGYATNPKYPQIIIKLIEDYNLQDYTLIAMGKKEASPVDAWAKNNVKNSDARQAANTKEVAGGPNPAPVVRQYVYPTGVFKINETPVVFVTKGTPFLVIAQQHNISLSRLFDFNDLSKSEEVPEDMLIFLHRERKEGATEFYTVAEGETVHHIAQAAGIRMESLLEYNMINDNAQPAAGEKSYLQRKAPLAPRMASVIKKVFSRTADDEPQFIVHTVQPKETVYSIAKRYAVDMDDLLKWNGLEKSDLKTGQQLKINKKQAMPAINVNDKAFEIFLPEEVIQKRIAELAADINRDYEGKRPLFIAIRNGSFMFASDLFKHLTIDAEICFIKLVSYKGMKSGGHITTAIGLDQDLYGRDVIIIEDIVDTGKTLGYFLPKLEHQQPALLKIAALLHKPDATVHPLDIHYTGFSIPNKFVVGYGLDYDGCGRNLKQIYQVVEGH